VTESGAQPGSVLMGDLVCPRCGTGGGVARFYGPCEACRFELRAKFPGDAGDAGGPRAAASGREGYEPKPNVTPNFVATKD
jgi:hypothetical protein